MHACIHQKACTRIFTSLNNRNAKHWKQSRYPSTSKLIKMRSINQMKYYLAMKMDIIHNLDESPKYDVILSQKTIGKQGNSC